jgi:hypothetical protein
MNSRVEQVRADLEAAKVSGQNGLVAALEIKLAGELKFQALRETSKKDQAARKESSNG